MVRYADTLEAKIQISTERELTDPAYSLEQNAKRYDEVLLKMRILIEAHQLDAVGSRDIFMTKFNELLKLADVYTQAIKADEMILALGRHK